MNAQTEDFFEVWCQSRRQLSTVKVFRNQRVVGGFESVLHGQVQAGRGFTAAAYTHQNHVGRFQIAVGLSIVVRQREVDRLDPIVVRLAFADIRKSANSVVRFDAQFCLQRVHKSAKHVEQHALAMVLQYLEDIHVHQSGEHNRFGAFRFCGVVDLTDRVVRLVNGVGEGQPHMAGLHVELGKNGVAKSLGRDACAVGDEKNSAF